MAISQHFGAYAKIWLLAMIAWSDCSAWESYLEIINLPTSRRVSSKNSPTSCFVFQYHCTSQPLSLVVIPAAWMVCDQPHHLPFPWLLGYSSLQSTSLYADSWLCLIALSMKLEVKFISVNQTSAVQEMQHSEACAGRMRHLLKCFKESLETHWKAHGGWVSLTQLVSYWQLDVSRFVKALEVSYSLHICVPLLSELPENLCVGE